jgi:hypothetical protein
MRTVLVTEAGETYGQIAPRTTLYQGGSKTPRTDKKMENIYRIYTKEWCGFNSVLIVVTIKTAPFFCVFPV